MFKSCQYWVCRKPINESFLNITFFEGIALCVWTLVMDGMSGIYLELVFLDGFLNFGQGLFAFAIFGFETRYILVPIKSCFRRLMYGQDSLVLPRWEDLVKLISFKKPQAFTFF